MALLTSRREGDTLVIKHHYPIAERVWAVLRLALGSIFFWAFLDKTFGFGFATDTDAAWINGASPTRDFLESGTSGPLAGFYQGLAGQVWVDWVFMIGLAGIGIAFLLGIGLRLAAATSALMLVMMYSAAMPPETHPFIDDHLVYALAMVALAASHAGDTWGLGRRWATTPLVQRYAFLK